MFIYGRCLAKLQQKKLLIQVGLVRKISLNWPFGFKYLKEILQMEFLF